jgi:hypothetical protein
MKFFRRQISITSLLSILLTVLGCLQFGGYLFNNRAMRGLGFAFGISPHPIVFSTVEGVEGFDTHHKFTYLDNHDKVVSVPLDMEHFSNLQGSFFLRNAFALFLAYPHMLKPEQVDYGTQYLLCQQGMFDAFDIREGKTCVAIESHRTRFGREFNSILTADCEQ